MGYFHRDALVYRSSPTIMQMTINCTAMDPSVNKPCPGCWPGPMMYKTKKKNPATIITEICTSLRAREDSGQPIAYLSLPTQSVVRGMLMLHINNP